MREVSMLVWREGSGARVERGDRHAPHVAHMVFFSGYVRLHAPDVSRRAPRVVALVRARHLCRQMATKQGNRQKSKGKPIPVHQKKKSDRSNKMLYGESPATPIPDGELRGQAMC